MKTDDIIKGYGKFIADHPIALLGICLILSLLAIIGATHIGMTSMDTADMLPDDIEVVSVMNFVEDEFGESTNAGKIIVEIDPSIANSTEPRDVRAPKVIKYVNILTQKAKNLEGIKTATSIADYLYSDSHLIQSEKNIRSRLETCAYTSTYISEDYSISLISLSIMPNADDDEIYIQLNEIIQTTPSPEGIKTQLAGDFAMQTALQEQIGPDMSKTSMYSMMGIFIIIFLVVFRSFEHGLVSLMAIVFGILWAYGLIGGLGMNMSSTSAGATSMVMGIGIDFGIQVVSRFRHEIERLGYKKATINTISGVTAPMATTTLAALIGFRAMSLGQLTMLADLGTIMAFGVLCCMASAITVIPALLVIIEKYIKKTTA